MSKRIFLSDIDLSKNQLLNPVLHNQTEHPGIDPTFISSGYTYYNTVNHTPYTFAPSNPNSDGDGWLNLGLPEGAGITDLTYTASTNTLYSSTGSDVVLPLANETNDGLMPSSYFTSLSGTTGTNTGDQSLTWTDATNNLAISNGNSVTITGFAEDDHIHPGLSDDYVSSAGFNTTDGILTLTRVSGGTVTVDLDGRYYEGTPPNDVDYVSNVTLSSTDLTFTGVGNAFNTTVDLSSLLDDTNFYLTSSSFNTTNGELTLSVSGATDVIVDLDGRYLLQGTYDNYNHWELYSDGASRGDIVSGEIVDFVGGSGINIAYTTTNDNQLTFNLDYLGTDNFIDIATNLESTAIATGDTIIYHDATDNNIKKGLVSDLPFNDYTHENHTGQVLSTGLVTVLNPNASAISGQTALTSDLVSTDELLVNDGGVLKRMDISVLQTYVQSNTTLAGLSDTVVSTPNSGHILIYDGTDSWDNKAMSGDITIDNTGLTAIGSSKVDWGMVNQSWIITEAEGIVFNDNDTTVPTTAAIIDYVNTSVTGQLVYQGGYNAGTNTPDLETPTAGDVNQGFTYTVTFRGDFFTEAVQVGDMLIAEVDDPSSLSDWTVVNKNIPDIVTGDLDESTSNILTIVGSVDAVFGSGTTIEVQQASSGVDGYLSGTDWNAFNNGVINTLTTTGTSGAATFTGGTLNIPIYANDNTNQLTTFTLDGDTGTPQTIAHGNTLNVAGGTVISTVVSATDTVTINHDSVSRSDGTSNESPAFGGTVDVVDSVTTSTEGHVTAINVKTITLPSIDADIPRKFSQTLTGVTTSHVVTHNLGTRDVSATVYTVASTYDEIECEVRHTSATQTTFNFNVAPADGEYRVVIIG